MADKKLRFHVVYASGEDPQYPASELNVHSSKSRGWASPRFCAYPQELGFAFDDGVVSLSQIQILSHQCKIAQRIELFVGFGSDYLHAEFRRLGYMSLESNERSDYKARELKSVYVSSEAQFVRLVIHDCYTNPHNVTKQVCIVAVNFKGSSGASGPGGVSLPAVPARRDPRGVHDLSLDMRMDPETAATIRQVSDMKDRAVADEDYETAKALKVVEADLLAMGSQIAQLIEEKNKAVDSEDYDRARVLRDEINAVRTSIDRRIASSGFGGRRAPSGMGAAPSYPPAEAPRHQAQRAPPQDYQREIDEPRRRVSPMADDRPLPAAAMTPHDDNDLDQTIGRRTSRNVVSQAPRGPPLEKPFPGDRPIHPAKAPAFDAAEAGAEDEENDDGSAFASGAAGESADAEQLAGVDGVASLPAPAMLKPALAKEFGRECSVFGEYIIRCFHSAQWGLREAAIKKIELELPSYEVPKAELLGAGAKLLAYVFSKEKNAQVTLAARELLPKLLAECSADVRKHDMLAALEPVISGLIDKLGDTNNRIRDSVIDALMNLADGDTVGPAAIASAVLRKIPVKQQSAWRPLKTRLEVAYTLVHGFGLSASGPLSDEAILGFMTSVNAYAHPNGEVREAAKSLTVLLHSLKGSSIERHLTGLRPQQLKEYQAAFEKGAPSDAPAIARDKPDKASAATGAPPSAVKKAPAAAAPAKGKPAAGAPRAAPPTKAPPPVEDSIDDEGICQFCEGCGPGATEQQLDLHYWQECPMLIGCTQCKQIIEIATLTEHLLSECEFRSKFRQCPRCKDAIAAAEYEAHVSGKTCKPVPSADSICPLCRADVGEDEEAWLVHLVDDGCPANPRTA